MLFRDVMVNEALKNQLVSLINSGRVSHAQLFASQPGSHSFALAVAYAQYLLCIDRNDSGDACGVCESCVKIEKLSHPDLHFYFPTCISKEVKKDPDSAQFAQQFRDYVLQRKYHININDWLQVLEGENKQASINVRDCSQIIHQNSTQSYQGGYKIYILWCVERLHHAASPKLLKTLEEPEKESLFILLTEQPDKVLATILSRTQLVKIPKLTEEAIEASLKKAFQLDAQQAKEVAFVADGNYNTAIELMQDDGITQTYLHHAEVLLQSCAALAKQQGVAQINYLQVTESFHEVIAKGREFQKSYVAFLTKMVRFALLMKSKNVDSLLRVSQHERAFLGKFHHLFTVKNAAKVMQELNKAIFHIERNGNSQLIFTDLYLQLSLLITGDI